MIIQEFNTFIAFSQCLSILNGRVSTPCRCKNELNGAAQLPMSRNSCRHFHNVGNISAAGWWEGLKTSNAQDRDNFHRVVCTC